MQQRLKNRIGSFLKLWTVPAAWIAGIAAAISPAYGQQVVATPSGAGTTVSKTGNEYDISGGTQAGGNLFHEFDEFSLAETETANFLGDSGIFNIVGQVSGASSSYIDGTVQVSGSDANLYLVNPSGVLFGANAQLSLQGSFAATTADQLEFDGAVLNVLDQGADYSAFLGDPSALHFTETSASAVVNQGNLAVAPGESILLAGGNVVNTGTLSAPSGEIGLVAVGGKSTVRYGIPGSSLSLEFTEGSVPNGTGFSVTDLPTLLTGSPTPLADALVLQSDGSYELGFLDIGAEEVSVAGEISTRATVGDGGAIAILGRSVDAFDAVIDASGGNGGNIRMGRDVGSGALPTSVLVWLHRTSVVRADGLEGAGGDIAVGSTRRARVQGDISAQGTTLGGLVETSSARLDQTSLRVDASGQTANGRWLAALGDVDIVSGATGFNQLDSSVIEATLDSGTDIEITTAIAPDGTGDILLSDSIAQNGGGNADLTLTGRRFINNGSTLDLSSTGQLTFGINQVNTEANLDSSSIESAIAAIGNVNGDRLIQLGSGSYDFTDVVDIDAQVDIEGAGIGQTLLSTASDNRVFSVLSQGDVALSDVTVTTRGLGAGDFGGGIASTGLLTVTDSAFVDNRSSGAGGAIAASGNLLRVSSTQFNNNRAQNGGAIALDRSTATFEETTFEGNVSDSSGGAIRAWNGSMLSLAGSVLSGNSSVVEGGALSLVDGSDVTLSNTQLISNEVTSASGRGGGLTLTGSSATIEAGSRIADNTVLGSGGAIALSNTATATVTASAITGNTAGRDGGGIDISDDAALTISTSSVNNNRASRNGGGLHQNSTGTLTLNNTSFEGNIADVDGGGFALEGSGSAALNAITIRDSEALRDGGALHLSDRVQATLNGATIVNNTAGDSGGAFYQGGSSDLSVTSALLADNEAAVAGGAIANNATDGELSVASAGLNNNVAGDRGGAISVSADSVLTITGVGFDNNEATTGDGGAVHVGGAAGLELEGAAFTNNLAGDQGGAVYYEAAQDAVIGGAGFNNNRAVSDGGAIANNATEARLTIRRVGFDGNVSSEDGGAIFTRRGTRTTLDRSPFSNNQAAGNGGAIYSAGELSMRTSNLLSNRSGNNGGGLYSMGESAVTDSTIDDNQAENGGAIYLGEGSLLLTDAALTNNRAVGGYGGGLLLTGDSQATLSGTLTTTTTGEAITSDLRVANNTATEDGGGIIAFGDSLLTLDGVLLEDNVAGDDGGGVAVRFSSQAVIENTNFESNRASGNGGGLYVNYNHSQPINEAQATVANTRFIKNETGASGGGLHQGLGSTVSVADSLFRANQAVDGGGLSSLQDVTLERLTVVDNVAQVGGGLSLQENTVMVEASVLEGNQASRRGGGIASSADDLTLRDSTVQNNRASVDGGGLRLSRGIATVDNSRFQDNQSAFGGGLELSGDAAAIVTNSEFVGNEANTLGGGIFVDDEASLQMNSSTLAANQAPAGGGLANVGTAELTNATLSGNRATIQGGAIYTLNADTRLTLRNATLTQNEADKGGGIAQSNTAEARLLNTIVAANVSTAGSDDVLGNFEDQGNNLIGSATGATGFNNSVLVGTEANPIDPRLAPLADNEGPTHTHLLQSGSAAINAGTANISLPTADQRGEARLIGSAVDIGAVELTTLELDALVQVASDPVPSEQLGSPVDDGILSTLSTLDPTLSPVAESLDADVLAATNHQEHIDDNIAIRRLERNFGQSFEKYWDLETKADLSFDDVQAVLQRAQSAYEVNSAVIYAVFVPEEDREKNDDEILRFEPAPSGDDLLSLALVMPEGELVRYESSITRREAERQVRMLRATVADPEDNFGYQPLTQQLYQWLLAPLEEDLAKQGIENLMYALDQGLRIAPVTAMRDYNGFSLERFGISVVPNMGLMQTDFSVPVRRATVAMGVSEFAAEAPLPAVPIELEMVKSTVPVSQTVLNEGTTAAALTAIQAMEQPGILHLATHATFDIHSPESSSIHLWDDPLSMKEFSDLDWSASDLELLILSACSTAMSSRNSELGFAGLAAASGVDASVGSLWQVSDVGTLALMSEFYVQLESTDLRFEALRRAQLALLSGETRIEEGNLVTSQGNVDLPNEWNLPDSVTLDHPFFWSAFTMVGNPW